MSWFNKLSVGAKLFAAFSGLLMLMVIMGSISIWKLASLNTNVTELSTTWIPSRGAANRLSRSVADHRVQAYKYVTVTTGDERAEVEKAMDKFVESGKEQCQTLEKLAKSAEEKSLLQEIDTAFTNYLAVNERMVEAVRAGKNDEARGIVLKDAFEARDKLEELVDKELELSRNGCNSEAAAAISAYSTGRNVTLVVLAVNIVLGLVMAYWISSWFTKAIVQVDQISDAVASASQELAAASEQLSSGAQQSASSLEETASSLEEMTATVRQNADNADQANQLANSSRETAEKGGEVVANAVKAMSEINQASKKIADIITTIDEIAFQTNLLALNAAVEAARAGEQGRGFAVVAGEVRNLAQRSATAAREIKGLIEDSVSKVETGSELVNRSGETLGAIVTSVKRVTDIVAEIAAASREQSAGIDQINKAVAQMDQVTQSNASQTEEMSGTAVALSGQAEQLQNVVAQFNVKKQTESLASSTMTRSTTPATSTKSSKPGRKAKAKPAKAPARELELVGAGVDGFEEF